jgi:hypothetical protein
MRILLLPLILALLIPGCSDNSNEVIDLSIMNQTMLSAAYDTILNNRDNYLGKTIKVRGRYAAYYWDVTGRHHHYVMVKPGDTCCAGDFEFTWSGAYPGDYPEDGAIVELTGVYSTYSANNKIFYYLDATEFTVLG